MGSLVAEVVLQYVHKGCISAYDSEVQRRPYHRNCSCTLHKSKSVHLRILVLKRRSHSHPKNRRASVECRVSMTSRSLECTQLGLSKI
ncbi:hypothetical protein GIB67_016785 [Kingdonia uniflora]|uniref:Uncharacterized protein n=1 Tax=Kingdonia uniflora TaxID=39325 RepID=A0A7J7LY25_9MAGN|nr:hypothetical protein GIB67_016785 [Kingdonia uniflora]